MDLHFNFTTRLASSQCKKHVCESVFSCAVQLYSFTSFYRPLLNFPDWLKSELLELPSFHRCRS